MKHVFATTFLSIILFANVGFAQEVDATYSETIVVTAKKLDTKVKVDRVVYNVKTRPDAASLDTSDILKKVPNVFVSATKSVTMNGGAYVSFLVNGRPVKSAIALNIPASQIKQIEVVSNPGAEFSSYTEAVINIITIKDVNYGWSGSLSAKADTLEGYRTGIDLLHGGINWDFNGSLTLRHSPEEMKTIGNSVYDTPQNDGYIAQNSNASQIASFDYIRTSAKWVRNFSEKRNLSFELGINRNLYRNKYIQTEQFNGIGIDRSETYTKHQRFTDLRHMGTISYENDKENDYHLTTSFGVNVSAWDSLSGYDGTNARSARLNNDYWYSDAKADIEKIINDDASLFFGISDFAMSGKDKQNFTGFTRLGESQDYLLNYSENNFATYAQIQTKLKDIEIKSGLRFERISRNLKNNAVSISGIKDTNLLLPSVHLSKTLNDENKLMASFTLRSDIPDITILNPAPVYNSIYEVTQGNPNLKTAKKLQGELNYIYDNKAFSINQRIYYRDTKNDINEYTILRPDGVYVTSYTNLGSSNTYGYAASLKKTFSKKFDTSFDIEAFHKEISAPASLSSFASLKYQSYNSKININYNPDKNNAFTFIVGYTGKTYALGVDTSPNWETEVQYNHNFKGGISLQLNVVNFGVSETITKNIYGDGYRNVQRVKTPSRLLKIGIAKTF